MTFLPWRFPCRGSLSTGLAFPSLDTEEDTLRAKVDIHRYARLTAGSQGQ